MVILKDEQYPSRQDNGEGLETTSFFFFFFHLFSFATCLLGQVFSFVLLTFDFEMRIVILNFLFKHLNMFR